MNVSDGLIQRRQQQILHTAVCHHHMNKMFIPRALPSVAQKENPMGLQAGPVRSI
jgi:hypothetical protein